MAPRFSLGEVLAPPLEPKPLHVLFCNKTFYLIASSRYLKLPTQVPAQTCSERVFVASQTRDDASLHSQNPPDSGEMWHFTQSMFSLLYTNSCSFIRVQCNVFLYRAFPGPETQWDSQSLPRSDPSLLPLSLNTCC